MPTIPDYTALGPRQMPQASRPLANVEAVGSGVQQGANMISAGANQVGQEAREAAVSLSRVGSQLAEAHQRIYTKQETVARVRDFGAYSETAEAEMRRLMTEADLSDMRVVETYGQFLKEKQREIIGNHAGSEESRLTLSARLEEMRGGYASRIAAASMDAQDKLVTDTLGGKVNVIASRVFNNPGSLAQNIELLEREITDMAPALRPDQERAHRMAGRERLVENAIGGMISKGALAEAERALSLPGVTQVLGETAQRRINNQFIEARQAIAAAGRPQSDLGKIRADERAGLLTPEEARAAIAEKTTGSDPLVKVLNPDGTVTYVPRSQAAGKSAPDEASIVFGPDGKPIFARGGSQAITAMQTGLTQAAQNKVNEELLSATNNRMMTIDIARRFKPEYQEIPTKIGMEWTALKEKGGGILGKASPEQKAALDDYSQYRASAAQQFALTLKEMSGVAVNPTEFKRAESWLPNPGSGMFDGDSPTELQSKVKRFREFQDKAIARLSYTQKNGLKFDQVELDAMPKIISKRGTELETQFKSEGKSGEELRMMVRRELAREFGLVLE
jgi:hypothetical protein